MGGIGYIALEVVPPRQLIDKRAKPHALHYSMDGGLNPAGYFFFVCCPIHLYQFSRPSPVRQETSNIFIFGFSLRTAFLILLILQFVYGNRSILFIKRTDDSRNMTGYLSGLSSPSVTLRIMAFTFSPMSNSAGHTRLPTFSTIRRSRLSRSRWARTFWIMLASRWQPPSVLICMARTPFLAMRLASTEDCISPSITAIR